MIEERGDNLHYKGRLGEGIDRSYHSTAEQIDHDLSGQYVLISDYFNYFGRNAVALSDHTLVKEGPGHRSKFPDEKRLNEPQYGSALDENVPVLRIFNGTFYGADINPLDCPPFRHSFYPYLLPPLMTRTNHAS